MHKSLNRLLSHSINTQRDAEGISIVKALPKYFYVRYILYFRALVHESVDTKGKSLVEYLEFEYFRAIPKIITPNPEKKDLEFVIDV